MTTRRLLGLLVVVVLLAGCDGDGDPSGPQARSLDAALIEAARRGDAEEVRRLLEQGAAVAARDPEGATALVAAAYGNHLEVARALVEAGADVNAKDHTEQSATSSPPARTTWSCWSWPWPPGPTSTPGTATTAPA